MNNRELEWIDGPLSSELRWGVKSRNGKGALINSTRIASVTKNTDKITDAGAQERWVITINSTLFDTGEPLKFHDTREDAKAAVAGMVHVMFSHMAGRARELM